MKTRILAAAFLVPALFLLVLVLPKGFAAVIMGILQAILGWIPIVGALIRLILSLLGLYCVAGIVLSILKYFQH